MQEDKTKLVFKGGTALRLCHFAEYRYSADLDFSLIDGLNADDALQLIASALVECKAQVGFPAIGLIAEGQPRIEYVDSPPHFEAVLRAVRRRLRFAFQQQHRPAAGFD